MSRSNIANHVSYNDLLKKTEHYDKDERYMAISDLCEALKRNASHSKSDDLGSKSSSGVGASASSLFNNPIDPQTERRICATVLCLLDDSSNDVQTVAVKTLSWLLITVQEEQVVEIADRLCTLMLDESKSDLRDVYAIGLKTLVDTVPLSMGNVVSHRLIGRLIDGIHKSSASTACREDKNMEDIILSCLNVIMDLLTRFGSSANSITLQHEPLLNVTLSQLASSRPVVRKRAGTTIGVLAMVISDALLHRLVDRILEQIDQADGLGKSGKKRARKAHENEKCKNTLVHSDLHTADTRSLIRAICTVSGTVGHRLNQAHIDGIIPIFLRFCDPDDAITGDDENVGSDEEMESYSAKNAGIVATGLSLDATDAVQIELRESCFAGFESFILRCPALIQCHLDQIVHSALAYMRYDPNYSYGDEDDNAEEEPQDIDDEEDENDEYSDEDEMSDEEDDENWKVRRSAIRTLTAVVEATKHNPSKLWIAPHACRKNSDKSITFAGALINRFKERDENCRVDIIECFTRLLSYTVAAASSGILVLASSKSLVDDECSASGAVTVDFGSNVSAAIVAASEKQLNTKKGGQKSKSSVIGLLSTLCLAPGGIGGSDQISSVCRLMKLILNADDDSKSRRGVLTSSKSLKLEALSLVRIMLSSKNHNTIHLKNALIPILLPEICKSVQEDWYKIIAEALRVIIEVPHVVTLGLASKNEQDSVAHSLYLAIEPRLSEHDLDQEIKECALYAAAALLSSFHTSLTDYQISKIFELVLERLKNDTTRNAAIKTLIILADAAQKSTLNLVPIMNETFGQLATILRQQHRGIKQSALECLDHLVLCLSNVSEAALNNSVFDSVLEDLGKMISDTDLHLCSLGCSACTSILKARPSIGPLIKKNILPATLQLSQSPLLQGKALSKLLRLEKQLLLSEAVSFDELYSSLTKGIGTHNLKSGKQVISNLAECVSTIAVATSQSKKETIINDTIDMIESANGNVQLIQLNLLVSGNFGRKVCLSDFTGVVDKLQDLYIRSLESSNEDIKHAAAIALGRASQGTTDIFLPGILNSLKDSNGKKQYLLLSSLRELIHCYRESEAGTGEFSSSIPLILPQLEIHCENEDEGVRVMVAECLGSLACIEPTTVLPLLKHLMTKESKNMVLIHWTIGNAIKFAIGGRITAIEIAPYMPTFLLLLQEDDLAVKNVALLMVYSAVHHTPQLVTNIMKEQILPTLYELAQLNMERKVDLGPFKHTVDDALPLRKAALAIVAICLEKCPSSLDIPAFMPVLIKALADVEDVQLQAHQIVMAMCSCHPLSLVAEVDSFVDPLEKTVNKKKGQKTGTELERVYEWIKSGLRVMLALSALEGAMNSRKFADFVERIKRSDKHLPFLQAVEEER